MNTFLNFVGTMGPTNEKVDYLGKNARSLLTTLKDRYLEKG